MINPKSTHIECVVEIKVIMAVKVAPDKFIDFGFACCMHVLKFVNRLKFNDIQAIWKNAIWFPFK